MTDLREKVKLAILDAVIGRDLRIVEKAHIQSEEAADAVLAIIRPAIIEEARARIAKLEKALANIAEQKTSSEIGEVEADYADWEGGFDECVKVARAALAEKP